MDEDLSYYVYLHRKASNNEVFYVGKGKRQRAKSKHNRNQWWHNIVNKHGFVIEYVEKGLSNWSATVLEIETIKFYRENGHTLCNLTDGGEGASGRVYSEETLRKMSDAKRGKLLSEGTKQIMSLSKQGKTKTREHVTKVAKSCMKKVQCSNGLCFASLTFAAEWVKEMGLSNNALSSIVACCRGHQQTAYGFYWSYLKEIV